MPLYPPLPLPFLPPPPLPLSSPKHPLPTTLLPPPPHSDATRHASSLDFVYTLPSPSSLFIYLYIHTLLFIAITTSPRIPSTHALSLHIPNHFPIPVLLRVHTSISISPFTASVHDSTHPVVFKHRTYIYIYIPACTTSYNTYRQYLSISPGNRLLSPAYLSLIVSHPVPQ